MKKLLFLMVLIAGIAAVVAIVRSRSEGSFDESWDTFADRLPSRVRDFRKSAA